jgi:AraC-like DNA-binding protein
MEGQRAFPLNRLSAPLGSANAVLRARSSVHYVKDFPGPLSIKSVTAGAVAWKVGTRDLLVDRDSFLVLNHGEPYSMAIESRRPVSTLCVFFQEGFVESVCGSVMDGEIEPAMKPVAFLARLNARDGRILPRMQAMAEAGPAGRLWADEQFLGLAFELLLLNREVRRRIRLLPARRAATRDELFRRVRRGQEFLHANACLDLDLAQLAREACLSPYHFHRAFTRAFGKTPHQYRNELRLLRARRLLETSQRTVTEICGDVGFESPASFSSLFRRFFGFPPSALRRAGFASFDKTPAPASPILLP